MINNVFPKKCKLKLISWRFRSME